MQRNMGWDRVDNINASVPGRQFWRPQELLAAAAMARWSGSVHLLPYDTAYKFGQYLLKSREGVGGMEKWEARRIISGCIKDWRCHQIACDQRCHHPQHWTETICQSRGGGLYQKWRDW